MIRTIVARAGLLPSLILALSGLAPALATAQTLSLEGEEWHLVEYSGDLGSHEQVPWSVDATLRLMDGVASGSTGCNDFSGSYELVGDRLSFGRLTVTQMACSEAVMAVEAAYLAAVARVTDGFVAAGPTAADTELHLFDKDSIPLLRFQPAVASLTRADVAALAAQLEGLEAAVEDVGYRVDDIRIKTLRERVRALEAGAAQEVQPDDPANTDFNAAEEVLLEGIPAAIRTTCVPRRSDNPSGTVAAVQCKPDAAEVRDMAYYLMEGEAADKVWRQRMKANGAWNRNGECRKGEAGTAAATGALEVSGCYRNDDGRANLRYAVAITECKELQAGATRLDWPALYIAVLGNDGDLAKLTKWAESRRYGGPEDLIKTIKRPNEAWSDACPT